MIEKTPHVSTEDVLRGLGGHAHPICLDSKVDYERMRISYTGVYRMWI